MGRLPKQGNFPICGAFLIKSQTFSGIAFEASKADRER